MQRVIPVLLSVRKAPVKPNRVSTALARSCLIFRIAVRSPRERCSCVTGILAFWIAWFVYDG